MTQKIIQRKRASLDRKTKNVLTALNALQGECQHPAARKKYCSSTGNWDKNDDAYWIEWHCDDCGKRWTTNQ